jgi:SAM-dependent methyltransferase
MLLGTGEGFAYQECAACGSLTLLDPPDAARYYPERYYRHIESKVSAHVRPFVRALRIAYDRFAPLVSPLDGRWGFGLRGASATTDRILDVGCGAGRMLERLHDLGMQDLTGVDPYGAPRSSASTGPRGSLRVIRGRVEDVEGDYDIVVLNHVLEHVEDPVAVLSAAKDHLSSRGCVVVRTPLIGYAWRRYGRFWVQLDAPRHLTLFSQRGLCACAGCAGLVVESITYDSNSFQFSGSEDYLHGSTPRVGGAVNTLLRIARSVAGGWALRAWLLNLQHDGDQAAFVMRRSA